MPSAVKSEKRMLREQAAEKKLVLRKLEAKHKRQIKSIRRTKKAEAYYKKHGKWPHWFGKGGKCRR